MLGRSVTKNIKTLVCAFALVFIVLMAMSFASASHNSHSYSYYSNNGYYHLCLNCGSHGYAHTYNSYYQYTGPRNRYSYYANQPRYGYATNYRSISYSKPRSSYYGYNSNSYYEIDDELFDMCVFDDDGNLLDIDFDKI